MDEYTKARRRAAQNAALLVCLRQQPASPRENKCVADGTSSLSSLSREMQLLDDFAFISSLEDNPNEVTAVCLETNPDGEDVMMQASSHDISRDTADQLLFEQITRMCFPRTLCRFRSRHAAKTQKTKKRQSMPLLLISSVSQCKLKPSVTSAEDDAVVFRMAKQCNELKDVFEMLESSQDKTFLLQHLKELLSLAYHFDVRTLIKVLSQSRAIDLMLRDYLPRAIKKLCRYREISIGLANAARTRSHGLFHSITVQPIDPPDLSVDLGTFTTALQNFEAVWSGAADEGSREQKQRLFEETRGKYYKRIRDNCTEFKVHAEVQILYFYEQQPHNPLPRAISSSKSACFLYNLFLEIHGKIIVPRTHGRLYDRWTLPLPSAIKPETMKRLLPVVQGFNRALEAKTLQALEGEIEHYKPPNESVLAIYDPWSSHSTVVPRQMAQGRATNQEFQVARYLPEKDSLAFATYLVYIRPLVAMIHRSSFGLEREQDLLFCSLEDPDEAWRATRLTGALKILSRDIAGVDVGVRSYRQLSIAVTEKHLAHLSFPSKRHQDKSENAQLEVAFAWQSGHRPLQRGTSYDIDAAFPDSLQPALLRVYKWASEEWHYFLDKGHESRHLPAISNREAEKSDDVRSRSHAYDRENFDLTSLIVKDAVLLEFFSTSSQKETFLISPAPRWRACQPSVKAAKGQPRVTSKVPRRAGSPTGDQFASSVPLFRGGGAQEREERQTRSTGPTSPKKRKVDHAIAKTLRGLPDPERSDIEHIKEAMLEDLRNIVQDRLKEQVSEIVRRKVKSVVQHEVKSIVDDEVAAIIQQEVTMTRDPRNAARNHITCRDEGEFVRVKKVAERTKAAGSRVLRDQWYIVKVDNACRVAVLDENGGKYERM
ncbi:hypothetical protein Q7P37_003030 [Cladosporium fusiforme]